MEMNEHENKEQQDFPMEDFFNSHYIRTRSDNAITHGFSDAFEQPEATDILINDRGGRHFRLILNGKLIRENPWELMLNEQGIEQGIPLLKWDSKNKKIINRTEKEIQAEINALPAPEPIIPIEERVKHLEAHQGYLDIVIQIMINNIPIPQQAKAEIMKLGEAVNLGTVVKLETARAVREVVHNE